MADFGIKMKRLKIEFFSRRIEKMDGMKSKTTSSIGTDKATPEEKWIVWSKV